MSNSKPNILIVLEALAGSRQPLSFSQLRKQTNLTPATLTRVLARLLEHDYVHKVAHGEYEAGPALVVLGARATENAAAVPYRPLLKQLADALHLNAELYALNPAGPVFLLGVRGHPTSRIGMTPGSVMDNVYRHAAGPFFFIRWPEAFEWRATQMHYCGINPDDVRARVQDVKDKGFSLERGSIQPEIARVCLPIDDAAFCVGLSGPVDELASAREEQVVERATATIADFQSPKNQEIL